MLTTGYNIIKQSIIRFSDDDCMTHASSLSYVFLLSIIPFSTMTVIMVRSIQTFFFPQTIGLDTGITEIITQEMMRIIPFISREWIQAYVINAKGVAPFTVINFLMLPIISGLYFKTLETSFRKIFNLSSRHLLKGQLVYVFLSVFVILSLFITNFAWSIMRPILIGIVGSFNQNIFFEPILHFFSGPIAFIRSNLITMFIQIIFIYASSKIFLNIQVRKTHILISGVLFWFLWIIAKTCFGVYINNISKINVLYGSLSSIVIILLWMFYSSVILLFSVEVMYTLHGGDYNKD